jgi:protein-disulfide isomerase
VLGAEKEIIPNYVHTGQVRLIYWPMLDHGQASVNAHAAADCVGRQDVDAFWDVHDRFYVDQGALFRADRDYFVQAAVSAGLDQAAFEACYDSGEAHARVNDLDRIRRERGIFNRPSFDINGQLLIGSQPFSVYEDYFAAASTN